MCAPCTGVTCRARAECSPIILHVSSGAMWAGAEHGGKEIAVAAAQQLLWLSCTVDTGLHAADDISRLYFCSSL